MTCSPVYMSAVRLASMATDVPTGLWVIHPTAPDADYRIEVTVGIDEVSLETGYKLSPRGEALLRRRSGVS
jgi:hypothetical protein